MKSRSPSSTLTLEQLMVDVDRARALLAERHDMMLAKWRHTSEKEQLIAIARHAKCGRALATLLARVRADYPDGVIVVRQAPPGKEWTASFFVLVEGYQMAEAEHYRTLCGGAIHVAPYDEHERRLADVLEMMTGEEALAFLAEEGWLP